MSRSTDLLLKAAAALEDGRDPFDIAFLSEHAVTLEECYTMGEQFALAARIFLAMQHAPEYKEIFAALVVADALERSV